MANSTQLKQKTAEMLGLVAIGQSVQSQHDAKLDEAYNEVLGRLQVNELAVWGSNTWDEVTPHFVVLMAYNLKDTYGLSPERYNRIVAEAGPYGDKAVAEIRRLVNDAYEPVDEVTDY